MHSSSGSTGIVIPSPPDWLIFLTHAADCTEKERRVWCRDTMSRDSGLARLVQEAALSGWCGPAAVSASGEDAILDAMETETVLSLACQLSLARWYQGNHPDGSDGDVFEPLLLRTLLTLSLAVGISEALKCGNPIKIHLHGMLSGVGDWLLLGHDSAETRKNLQSSGAKDCPEPEEDQIDPGAALRDRALRSWGVDPNLDDSIQALIHCASAGAAHLVRAEHPEGSSLLAVMTDAYRGSEKPLWAFRELLDAPGALIRDTWLMGDRFPEWPGRITPLLEHALRQDFATVSGGYSMRGLRRLTKLMDQSLSLDSCVDFIFRFSRRFLNGMIPAIAWRDVHSEPGSSWFRVDGRPPIPLPDILNRSVGSFDFSTISVKNLPDGLDESRDKVWVFPFSGMPGTRGWLLATWAEGDFQDSCHLELLSTAASRLGSALQVNGWKIKCRAESSKNTLLRRELLLVERKLEERDRVIRQLQQAVAFRDVLPGIFHKLKNKLTPIMGYAQMLKSRSPDEYTVERLGKIEKSTDSLANLLNRMRAYFSPSPLFKRPTDLNWLILSLKPRFEESARKNGSEIVFDLDDSLFDFPMIAGQIEVLLKQVMGNAVRAVAEKKTGTGRIEVSTRNLDGKECELRIRDSGIGIPEADFERIWAPFQTGFTDADGLGLTLCEQILLRHNAGWRVESHVGKFSEFVFVFPLRDQNEAPAPTPEPDSRISGRVLILDDEDFMVELMGDMLTEVGDLDVHATTSGIRALRWLQEQEYDLVIADLYLPDINGLDIFRAMNDRGIADRLILVTADPGNGEVRDFLESRRITYLRKPIELIRLKQRVIEKLSRKEA